MPWLIALYSASYPTQRSVTFLHHMLRATGITKRDKIKGLAAANEGRDVVNITLEVSLQDYFSSNSLDFSSGEIPSNGLQAGGNPVFVAKRHNHRLLPQ